MYEGIKKAIQKAVADPRVIKLGSALIYLEEDRFSYGSHVSGEEYSRGNVFIKIIIANEESYS